MAFSSSTGVRGWDSYSDNSAWVCGILIIYCSPRLGSYSNIGAWVCGILSAARGRDPYSDPGFFLRGCVAFLSSTGVGVGVHKMTLVLGCVAFWSFTAVRVWDPYSDTGAWVCGILIIYCSPGLGSIQWHWCLGVWHFDHLLQSGFGIHTVTLVLGCVAFWSFTAVRVWDTYSDTGAWVCGILIIYCSPRLGSIQWHWCVGVWHFDGLRLGTSLRRLFRFCDSVHLMVMDMNNLRDLSRFSPDYIRCIVLPSNLWPVIKCRADSRFAPGQWEAALLCNDVSHWLDANLESALKRFRGTWELEHWQMSRYFEHWYIGWHLRGHHIGPMGSRCRESVAYAICTLFKTKL